MSWRISIAHLLFSVAFFITPVFAGSALWDLIPASDNWNSATNWNPSTVPNGPADTATFGFSISTVVSLSDNTEVDGIVFNSTALIPYIVTVGPNSALTISGAGITNNSGGVEAFVTTADMPAGGVVGGRIFFSNSATAGSSTVFTNNASTASVDVGGGFTAFSQSSSASTATITNNGGSVSTANTRGGFTSFGGSATASASIITNNGAGNAASPEAFGFTLFSDMSSAGAATITNNGGTDIGAMGGVTSFNNSATVGTATINNNGGEGSGVFGGETEFFNSSTAGAATINNTGGTVTSAGGAFTRFFASATAGTATITNSGGGEMGAGFGLTQFLNSASAGSATIINNGETVRFGGSGLTQFSDSASADNATIINQGATVAFARGSSTRFDDSATAANATLISNGGGIVEFQPSGGSIVFTGDSTGGTSQVEVFSNGQLDISAHNSPGVTIGSIEGDGNVFLGARNLSVGSNDRSTIFSGVMQDFGSVAGIGGSLTKIGTGTTTLSGTNTYTGATTVNAGKLLVDGSIASSSGVTVNAGATLGGHGIVGSIGGAGAISPGNSPGILTATQVDPSGGTSFVFELTQVGSPTYSNAAASGNDLLHLTSATPFTMALTSANQITIDFSGASLAAGEVFRGGFFTDTPTATSMVSGADFVYTGTAGFTVNFDGFVTEPMAAFASGTALNGTVLEFDISETGRSVPDYGSTALFFALGLAGLALVQLVLARQRANASNGQE